MFFRKNNNKKFCLKDKKVILKKMHYMYNFPHLKIMVLRINRLF